MQADNKPLVTDGATISMRTTQRAAISLDVVKEKSGFGAGWVWRLTADEIDSADAPAEQPARAGPSRAEVIASGLRKFEFKRRKLAPIYAADPRIIARAASSTIGDPDLREAYLRVTTDHTGTPTAGIMDNYFFEIMKEAA